MMENGWVHYLWWALVGSPSLSADCFLQLVLLLWVCSLSELDVACYNITPFLPAHQLLISPFFSILCLMVTLLRFVVLHMIYHHERILKLRRQNISLLSPFLIWIWQQNTIVQIKPEHTRARRAGSSAILLGVPSPMTEQLSLKSRGQL